MNLAKLLTTFFTYSSGHPVEEAQMRKKETIFPGDQSHSQVAPKKTFLRVGSIFVCSIPSSATRLGQFSPIGRLFTPGSFFQMSKVSPIFGILFSL
jgi:hypothetical protein